MLFSGAADEAGDEEEDCAGSDEDCADEDFIVEAGDDALATLTVCVSAFWGLLCRSLRFHT